MVSDIQLEKGKYWKYLSKRMINKQERIKIKTIKINKSIFIADFITGQLKFKSVFKYINMYIINKIMKLKILIIDIITTKLSETFCY